MLYAKGMSYEVSLQDLLARTLIQQHHDSAIELDALPPPVTPAVHDITECVLSCVHGELYGVCLAHASSN
jgi:hypothetical protein